MTVRRLSALALLAVVLAATVPPASAQSGTGALYGVVTDDAGEPLSCVTVTVTGGQGRSRTQTTNARGEFRLPSLFPGVYQGKVELPGYSTSEYADIPIHLGGTTTIDVTLYPADDDAVTLTAECPLVDERRIHSGVTITRDELEKVPTARNPWALLRQAPGVLLDRVDVGGSEGAHPAVARAPAVSSDQNLFAIEGVPITDPHALAAAPTFYDFESLEEVQVATGGSDAAVATAGVVLNLVTRRATNDWRLSGRWLSTDDDWQPSPDHPELAPGQPELVRSPRVEDMVEHAADAGGPLVRDRVWGWAGYNRTDVEMALTTPPTSFAQGAGDREAENATVKLEVELDASHRLHAFGHRSDLDLAEVGGGPSRAGAATWDLDAPTWVYELESDHLIGPRFHVGAQVARVESDHDLDPRGGGATPVLGSDSVFRDGFLALASARDRDHLRVDASAFWGAGAIGHELKAGASHRDAAVTSTGRWGVGSSVFVEAPAAGSSTVLLFRPGRTDLELDVRSAWVQDSLAIGDLQADVGVRYDRQSGERAATMLEPSPLRPDLLPAVLDPGGDGGFEWETVVPRVGLTYVVGGERATLLRASWSRFADQLGTAVFSDVIDDPAASPLTFAEVRFTDVDGDRVPAAAEPQTVRIGTLPATLVDRSFDAPQTDELLVAAEHSGVGCYSIGGRLTWRRYRDTVDERRLVREPSGVVRAAVRSDFGSDGAASGELPGGAPYVAPTFALRSGLDPVAGRLLANGGRQVEYEGATLWVERRLRARWQLRGFVNLRDEEWSVPEDYREIEDPTNRAGTDDDDRAPFAPRSAFAAKSGVRLHAEWDYSVAGLYRARAGFAAGILAHGRQGYPLLYSIRVLGADGIVRDVAATDETDPLRLDDLHQVDVRLEKEVRFRAGAITIGADAFNLLNRTPTLQRGTALDSPAADFLREIVSPRIVRLGLRVELR